MQGFKSHKSIILPWEWRDTRDWCLQGSCQNLAFEMTIFNSPCVENLWSQFICFHELLSSNDMVKAEHMNSLNKYSSGCQLYLDYPYYCVPPPSSTPSLNDQSFSTHPLSLTLLPLPFHLIGHWEVLRLEATWGRRKPKHWDIFGADGDCEICPSRTECCREQSRDSASALGH